MALASDPSGGTAPYSYEWYADASCSTSVPEATSASYTASPTKTTVYYYKVTDSAYSPASACSPGDTVTVGSTAVVTIKPTQGPPGTLIFLSGSGFIPSGTYNYCFEPGVTTTTMAACPPTYQFTSTSDGGVPGQAILTAFGQTGLVVVSDSATGQIVAYALFTVTPSGSASITLTPDSGVTGTPVTVKGTGFTPGVTVSIIISRAMVATAEVASNGTFITTFTVPSSPPGSATVTASGSDVSTDLVDVTTANFDVTNVGTYHSGVFPTTNSTGTLAVNQTSITQLSVSITGISNTLTSLRVELANLSQPSYHVSSTGITGNVWYYDVYVAGNGTITSGMTAMVCVTNPSVVSTTSVVYWDGAAWVAPSGITVSSHTICGTVPVTGLTGTNFAIGNNAASFTTTTTTMAVSPRPGVVGGISWIWFLILPLLIGSLVFFLLWFFIIAGKRRRKDEDEEEFQRRHR